MESLVSLLNAIDVLDMSDSLERLLNNSEDQTAKDLAEKAAALADTLLIGLNRECLWIQHDILSEAGYSVFAGEKDSFGWLTGCIQTKKGIVMFG
jgi:hypothetical protein